MHTYIHTYIHTYNHSFIHMSVCVFMVCECVHKNNVILHTHTHTHTHTHSGIGYGPCRCQWVLGICTRRSWLWPLPPRSFHLIDAGPHRSRALHSADNLLLSLNEGACMSLEVLVHGGGGDNASSPLSSPSCLSSYLITYTASFSCPWLERRARACRGVGNTSDIGARERINRRSARWPRGQGALGVSVARGAAPLCARRRGFPRAALHAWCPHR